jgi:glycosyltransferase involved in cell wall biosynthesis
MRSSDNTLGLQSRHDNGSLHVLHVVNELDTGGAQTLIEALVLEQREMGVNSSVLSLLGRSTLSTRIERAASAVIHLDVPKSFHAFPLAVLGLRRAIARLQPDVVHSHLLQADLVSHLGRAGLPHVSTVHTSGGHESTRSAKLVTLLVGALTPRLDALVACSSGARDFCRHTLGREPDRVILNGTRVPSTFAPREGGDYVLSLARWHPMKDHDTLFAALARLGDEAPMVVCAGAGMTEDEAGRVLRARYPSVSCRFEGARDAVEPLIAHASCLVISSSHGEALPMAGLEALSHGLPVITTDVGDCARLAVDARLLVKPKDSAGLAESLRLVTGGSPRDAHRFSALARRLAEREFDARSAAATYLGIYRGLAGPEGRVA